MIKLRDLQVSTKVGNIILAGPVSLSIKRGEIYGIVGESGSGKTTIGMAIPRLLPSSLEVSGEIIFEDINLTSLSERDMRKLRGARIAMIFQDPSGALNPVFTIGQQIEAAIRAIKTKTITKHEAREKSIGLLSRVGIPNPEQSHHSYPHQLSGGMCQRVMIAMALASEADVIVADEPTSALDVTIQAQIVNLLVKLVHEEGLTLIFISHDLGLVAQTCDRVAVFYAGEVVEIGSADVVMSDPLHPYTVGLVSATPDMEIVGKVLRGIPGRPPAPGEWNSGCRFFNRCERAQGACESNQSMRSVSEVHQVRCLLVDGNEEVA